MFTAPLFQRSGKLILLLCVFKVCKPETDPALEDGDCCASWLEGTASFSHKSAKKTRSRFAQEIVFSKQEAAPEYPSNLAYQSRFP